MKKSIKKLISITIAVLTVLMCTISAHAAEVVPVDTGSEIINIQTLTEDILSGDFSSLFILTEAFVDAGTETGLFEEIIHLGAAYMDMVTEFLIIVINFIF